jgi:type III pantothenate kinase
MLLVIDIGNTNIVAGIYTQGVLSESFRIHTVIKKTEDEYGTIFRSMFADRGIDSGEIDETVISSVVPALSPSIASMVIRVTGTTVPIVLGPSVYPFLPLEIVNPLEIGTDLVANSLAAWTMFKGPCIIVDFGTALTFTCVDAGGSILGVAIAPGLNTAVASLSRDTAQLPFVQLAAPSTVLGKNTVHSIQSGIVLGYSGLVESMVGRIGRELGEKPKVVATGGLCGVIAPLVGCFDLIEPNLTLNGLSLVAGYARGKLL